MKGLVENQNSSRNHRVGFKSRFKFDIVFSGLNAAIVFQIFRQGGQPISRAYSVHKKFPKIGSFVLKHKHFRNFRHLKD